VTASSILVVIAGVALGIALAPRLSVFAGPDFREGVVSAQRPVSLDPLIGADTETVHDVGHLLYRSLMRLDSSAFPRPDLAKSLTVSQDGLTYTAPLAAGERWSNGNPIQASDVLATLRFAQSSSALDTALAGSLLGVRATASGPAVTFTLPSPRASFGATLTQLPILPLGTLSRAQMAALPSQAAVPMPTSGPYRVLSAEATVVELQTNPFARTRPVLGHVELRVYSTFGDAASAFAKGDVDAVLATTPQQRATLTSTAHARAHDVATFRFVDLLFNERVGGLDDPVVRLAISNAINRQSILGGALAGSGGLMQVNPFSEGLRWIATQNPPETSSPSAASSALDADRWKLGPTGIRERGSQALDFTLKVANAAPLPEVAKELTEQLSAIGMRVRVEVVPSQSYVGADLAPHTFEMALADWDGGPDPDVSSFWRSNASPPKGFYVSRGGPDAFLDQALDTLSTVPDAGGRIAAAASVSGHLLSDAPAVFLYTPSVSYVIRGPLAGAEVPSVGGGAARFDDINAWRR